MCSECDSTRYGMCEEAKLTVWVSVLCKCQEITRTKCVLGKQLKVPLSAMTVHGFVKFINRNWLYICTLRCAAIKVYKKTNFHICQDMTDKIRKMISKLCFCQVYCDNKKMGLNEFNELLLLWTYVRFG